MIWALGIAVVLHVLIWLNFTLKPKPPEHPPEKVIEVSLITKTAPIKAKQNDQIVAEPQPASLPEPPKPQLIKPVDKPVEKSISKSIEKPVEQKKEPPKQKVVTVQKSEVVVKKDVKPAKTAKAEPLKKVEEPPKEKPRLSLESLQQQIVSQAESVVSAQSNQSLDVKLVKQQYRQRFISRIKNKFVELYPEKSVVSSNIAFTIKITADGTISDLVIKEAYGGYIDEIERTKKIIYASQPFEPLPFELGVSELSISVNFHIKNASKEE